MLSGYKTYITGAIAIVTAVGTYLYGGIDLTTMIQGIFASLMAMFIRHGVSTSTSGN